MRGLSVIHHALPLEKLHDKRLNRFVDYGQATDKDNNGGYTHHAH